MIPYEPRSPESVWSESGAIEHLFWYPRYARVELDNLESRGGPSSVLNPLEAGRSASSRLSR